MQMPAVIKRVTWCLDMETLLLRLPSLQGDRAQAAVRSQGLSPPKRQAPIPINPWAESGGPGWWLGVDAYRSKGHPPGVIAP